MSSQAQAEAMPGSNSIDLAPKTELEAWKPWAKARAERAKINSELAGGIEVPLETIAVHFPEQPMLINGVPHGFQLEQDRLVSLIQYMRDTTPSDGEFEPRALFLEYTDSLPPKLAKSKSSDHPRSFVAHRGDITSLHLQIPKEISKSDATLDELTTLVEEVLSRDVKDALDRNSSAKKMIHNLRFRQWSSLAIGGATGEGVGLAVGNENALSLLWRGSLGAAIGIFAAGLAVGVAHAIREEEGEKLFQRIANKIAKKQPKDKPDYGPYEKPLYEQPVIRLVRTDMAPQAE